MNPAQTTATTSDWQAGVAALLKVVRPEALEGLLSELAAKHGGKQAVAALLTTFFSHVFVVPLGPAAALDPPLAEAPMRLAAMAQALSQIDYQTGLERLSRKERRLYRAFSDIFAPYVTQLGQVMERVFVCYVRGDYDLSQDPNDLILQAEQLDDSDHEAALNLIARAGAMALRGVRYWWRWEDELAQPLQPWVLLINMVVNTLTETLHGPLDTAIVESGLWQQAAQEVQEEGSSGDELTEDQGTAGPTRPLDPWIQKLYDGAEALTPEVRQAFAARAQQAIPLLITLGTDEDLMPEDAPGEGYTPIHAVELLGELHAVEAVPALIDIVAASEPGEVIRDAALYALEAIGSPAAPALLATLRYSRNITLKADLAPSLAKVGVGEAAVFEALEQLYHQATWDDRILVVTALGILGDKRAIPWLQQDLTNPGVSRFDREELYAVLRELGAQGPEMEEARRATRQGALCCSAAGPHQRAPCTPHGPQRPVPVRQRQEVQALLHEKALLALDDWAPRQAQTNPTSSEAGFVLLPACLATSFGDGHPLGDGSLPGRDL